MRIGLVAAAVTGLVSVSASYATVLTFNMSPYQSTIQLPQAYGDRVAAESMVDGSVTYLYESTGGFTPNVVADYLNFAGTDFVGLTKRTNGSNDLTRVAEYELDGADGWSVQLTADAGYTVTIGSFDIGNFAGNALTLPGLSIVDGSGSVLWSQSNIALTTGNIQSHLTFSPNITGTNLRLIINTTGLAGNSDDIALDNLTFSQAMDVVPEPATLGLFASSLLLIRRRR